MAASPVRESFLSLRVFSHLCFVLFVAFCVALIPVRVCLGCGAALPGAVESRVRQNSNRSVRLVCQYGQSGIVWLSLSIWLTCLIILGFFFFSGPERERKRTKERHRRGAERRKELRPPVASEGRCGWWRYENIQIFLF